MKNLLRVMLEGAFTNFKRIFFASDRVTDMDIRNSILEGRVKATEKVAKVSCIGCGGCANVCPTNAIDMKALDKPILITDEWRKKELPVLNSEKCVFCYHCHDFCPTYALFGEKATIHPNDVGEVDLDMGKLIETPIKISDDKLTIISQFLADKNILKKEDIDKKMNKFSEPKNIDDKLLNSDNENNISTNDTTNDNIGNTVDISIGTNNDTNITIGNNNTNDNLNDNNNDVNSDAIDDTDDIDKVNIIRNIEENEVESEIELLNDYILNDDEIYTDVIEIRDNLIAKIEEDTKDVENTVEDGIETDNISKKSKTVFKR